MKRLLLILPLLIGLQVFCQKKEGIHQGMIRVQGTAAIGFDLNKTTQEQRYYIYGEAEYLLSGHIGVNGSVWANIGSSERRLAGFGGLQEDAYVHSILAGPIFHAFTDQPFDLYLGVQPGFSLTTVKNVGPTDGVTSDFQVSPTASLHGGVAYYGSFFHLFAQARYVRTQHFSLAESNAIQRLAALYWAGIQYPVGNFKSGCPN